MTPTTRPPDQRHWLLALVLTSYLMIVLDVSIVITGLPQIRQSLGFTAASLSWVHTAYTLTFGGLLLVGARASDLFGRRRLLIAGLLLFTLASLLIGLSTSPAMLIAARALQGVGAAVLAPTTMALLSVTFTQEAERTQAMSLYGATAGIGASIGLVLGGVLADLLSWRVGFFINLPIGALLIWAAWRFVPTTPVQPGRLDLGGAALSTLGMLALVFGLIEAADSGWRGWPGLAALAAAVPLLVLFVQHERSSTRPLLPRALFADRGRLGAYAARALFMAGVVGFWFYTSQYLQGVLGMRPLQAGMAFLPASVLQFGAALWVTRLSRHLGVNRVMALGLGLTAVGMGLLALIGPESDYLTKVALPMAVLGIGQGLCLGPLTQAGVARVGSSEAGAAAGAVNTAHQLGGTLGLALQVAVFAGSGPQPGHADLPAELAHRIAACMAVGSGLLFAALLVVWLLIPIPQPAQSVSSRP